MDKSMINLSFPFHVLQEYLAWIMLSWRSTLHVQVKIWLYDFPGNKIQPRQLQELNVQCLMLERSVKKVLGKCCHSIGYPKVHCLGINFCNGSAILSSGILALEPDVETIRMSATASTSHTKNAITKMRKSDKHQGCGFASFASVDALVESDHGRAVEPFQPSHC